MRYMTEQTPGAELGELLIMLGNESDRGCALVAGAFIDELLGVMLRAFFINDEKLANQLLATGAAPPLRNFGHRIQVAHALALTSAAENHDLTSIKVIRNAAAHFAHGTSMLGSIFDQPKVKDRCAGLKLVPPDLNEDPRARFMIASGVVVGFLFVRTRSWAADRRATPPDRPWPSSAWPGSDRLLSLAKEIAHEVAVARRRREAATQQELKSLMDQISAALAASGKATN